MSGVLVRGMASMLIAAVTTAATAPAAEPEAARRPAMRRLDATRPWASQHLERARRALEAGRLAEALAPLQAMERSDARLNETERALLHQTLGYVHSAREEYALAATSFERALATDALPGASRATARRNLAQLYVALGRHEEAIALFAEWFAADPDPPAEAHYMVANAYMQRGDAARALTHARAAVQARRTPPEGWMQLLLALLIDRARYAEAVPVAERLVAAARGSSKQYWLQLSALHAELGDPRRALGAMLAAHAHGVLTTERELTHLAQLLAYNGVPYRGGTLLEAAMADGRVPESVESLELLANIWLQARERERALVPLARAAARSTDGALHLRLAQLLLDRSRWTDARTALTEALRKGGLDQPGVAHLLLGSANVSLERWADARRAFEAARRDAESRAAAEQWLASLERAGTPGREAPAGPAGGF